MFKRSKHTSGNTYRLTAFAGAVLMAAAALVTPPGIAWLTLGHDSIQSPRFRAFAWLAALFLCVCGALLIRLRRRLSGVNLALSVGSLAFALILAEVLLALAGFESPYRLVREIPQLSPHFVPGRETGTRMARESPFRPGWPVNSDGFGDADEFVPAPSDEAGVRVLFLGDSFTFGVNASDYRNTFVSIVEQRLQAAGKATVWNTGIPGTGQPEHWLYLQEYFPRLRPRTVVLPFCTNDFNDNLYPPGAFYVFEPNTWINRYAVSAAGDFVELTPDEAYRRAMGAPSEISDYLALSRTGYLIVAGLRTLAMPAARPAPTRAIASPSCPGYDETKDYLLRIRDYVESHRAAFLLIPIPFAEDLVAPSACYLAIAALCEELGIDNLDVRGVLGEADYSLADRHWNDSGHRKVAEAVLARITVYFQQ